MRATYELILRLYPAEHRKIFAQEMLTTFDQVAAGQRGEATRWFVVREYGGLLTGLLTEWTAKFFRGDKYLVAESLSHSASEGPADAYQMQAHIQGLIRGMELAIAHHDFPRARFYSNEERAVRAKLEMLLDEPQG